MSFPIKQRIANMFFPHKNMRYMTKYVRDNHNSNSGLIGAEIGVKGANNAINILKNLNMECLYLVDAFKKYNGYKYWDKNYEPIAKKRLKKYGDETDLMVDFSQDAVKQFQDGFFDFVYIDANHKYKYVKQDIELWYPKVKNDGILGGHDFKHGQYNDVYRAVMEFVDKEGLKLKSYGDDWWVIKKLNHTSGV